MLAGGFLEGHCIGTEIPEVTTLLSEPERIQMNKFIDHVKKFFKWAILGLYFCLFNSSTVHSKSVNYKILAMAGFEPRTSYIRNDCSAK